MEQRRRTMVALSIAAAFAAVFAAAYGDVLLCRKLFTHDSIIWFGSYHYFFDTLLQGQLPLWDPYLQGGTYFYPNISLLGLLDPLALLSAAVAHLAGTSLLTGYVYFYLSRLLVFGIGACLFFAHLARNRISALIASGVLVISLTPAYFRQPGAIDLVYLTPFALVLLLKLLEQPQGPRRSLYVLLLALVLGITANVFIPSYSVFTIALFAIVLAARGLVPLREAGGWFRDRRMLALLALALVLVLMLAAPPLVVMFQDARGDGELFPMVRIIQKNDGYFKKIMATEVGSEAVSSEFTGHQGVFSSYGNFVNMLFPDVFESVPFFANDLLSEIPQYIGVIPLLVSVIGMLYSRSRYRTVALIMMAVLALNMFSFDGMSGKPFNLVQKMFNTVFPPLKMIEVREAFGSFYLLFHGVLVCLGLNILLDREAFTALVREKRTQLFIIIGLMVLGKVAITAYYAEKAVFASPIDLLVLVQMALFAAAVQAARSARFPRELLLGGLLLLVLADLAVYSRYNAKYILADSADAYEIADFSRTNEGRRSFAYFKEPWVATPGFAYGESITRIKGVLSPGNNHTIFSTKRYYDLVTHVPVKNHLALSGVLQPVVRFFPAEQAVPVTNGPAFLEYAATAREEDLAERIFIERPDTGAGRALRSVGQLKSYPNVPELHPANLYPVLQRYQNDRQQFLQARQASAAASFATDEHRLAVVGDTANSVAVQVQNLRAGYLYLNDGWSKYWRAFDDGREIPLSIANYNSKAVFLEPGEHVVRFSFEPVPYKTALLLFASGLVIMAGLLAVLWWKLRSKELPAAPPAAAGACRVAGEEP